jgi:hypothetical protein
MLDSPPSRDVLLGRAQAFSYDKAITGYEAALTAS